MPNRLWITQYTAVHTSAPAPMSRLPPLAKRGPIDLTDGTAKAVAVDPKAEFIRVVCEVNCAISLTGVATNADTWIPKLVVEFFFIPKGTTTISVIMA